MLPRSSLLIALLLLVVSTDGAVSADGETTAVKSLLEMR
jgi:hypothetical protein